MCSRTRLSASPTPSKLHNTTIKCKVRRCMHGGNLGRLIYEYQGSRVMLGLRIVGLVECQQKSSRQVGNVWVVQQSTDAIKAPLHSRRRANEIEARTQKHLCYCEQNELVTRLHRRKQHAILLSKICVANLHGIAVGQLSLVRLNFAGARNRLSWTLSPGKGSSYKSCNTTTLFGL